jgi:hypothetical protein
MRPRLSSAQALAVVAAALALAVPAPAAATPGGGDLLPEYGVLVSAVAGGLAAARPIYRCGGPDLLAITEALNGPERVQEIGVEIVAQSLGSTKKPWPRNRRAYVNNGRRHVPDFVKGGSFYQVETGKRLDLTPELRDLQTIARRRGGDLVIVTRKTTSLGPSLVKAAKDAWQRKVGRLRIARCV